MVNKIEDITAQIMRNLKLAGLAFLIAHLATAQSITPDLQNKDLWVLPERGITNIAEGGIQFESDNKGGQLILKDYDFKNGIIEFDAKGENNPGASFLGLAFNIRDQKSTETLYFRPFNFQNEARKTHAVQYTFEPVFGWNDLRQNFPDKYENQLDPAPNPEEWFHVRITINGGLIKAFVNNNPKASLVVKSISKIDHGQLGLWCEGNSKASFKNLKITPAPERKYGYNDAIGKYYEVAKDTKLYYEIYGEGEPILMLHGGVYGYIDEYEFFIDELSKNYKVICLGTRGHVKSDVGHEPYTYDQRASDAKKFLDHLGIEKAKVIGFSDGGYSAYKLAANYPRVVEKIVVIGAGDRPAGSSEDFGYNEEKLMKEAGSYFKGRLAAMREPERWNQSLLWLNDLYLKTDISKSVFEKIKCPVLILAGERDEYSGPENMLKAKSYIESASLAIIPNCGHVVFYCNWDAVWAMVKPYLDKK